MTATGTGLWHHRHSKPDDGCYMCGLKFYVYPPKDGKYWKERYDQAEQAWQKLKLHTKEISASEWDGRGSYYRELADLIHSLGRDVFYVDEED